ncbi:MAG: MBL fold metallo-hydrolase [Parvularculales bacterium]
MRKILIGIVVVVAVGAGGVWAALQVPAVQDALFERALQAAFQFPGTELLDNDTLDVIVCGSGSPIPDPSRAGPCVAVLAGGHFLLFDAGAASSQTLARALLPQASLDGVIFTHLHSDHISGLGDVALQSWAAGRIKPLDVYGPPGVERVVNGFEEAYHLDDGYRIAHHGEAVVPAAAAPLVFHEVIVSDAGAETIVLDDGNFRVTAFLVDHAPVAPAYGYRVDYEDRSVVISGDTVKHDNIARVGAGTDVLIHEALNKDMVMALSRHAKEAGLPNIAAIFHDITDYHATPVEAAESANEAGAGLLVLTHIVPALLNDLMVDIFMRGVDDIRPEGTMLGYDGLHIALPAGSREIDIIE